MSEKTNIAEMNSTELETHIESLAKAHANVMKTLRALARARLAEEEAAE